MKRVWLVLDLGFVKISFRLRVYEEGMVSFRVLTFDLSCFGLISDLG